MTMAPKSNETSFSTPGRFITFEGGEGAGKSTIMHQVALALEKQGLSVVKTREPGGSMLGEHIRQWLLDKSFEAKVGDKAELLLFLAARVQHVEELIMPALKAKKVVLCDRFNDSTVAYQGAGRGLGMEYIQQLCEMACEGLTPDITLLLDIDPKVGLERTLKTAKENALAGEMDRIELEKLEFHEKVRKGFMQLAEENSDRIHVVDASQPLEAVFAQCMSIINSRRD